MNHALHVAAITQLSHDTPGRAYFLRKVADGKTRKEALRALKRRISNAVYRQLVADTRRVEPRQRVQRVMDALSHDSARPLIDAMAEDVTWRWMGVSRWSKTFVGREGVANTLFGGAPERSNPSSFVKVHHIQAEGDFVVVEHSGRNELPDGRRYDNNYCWVFQFHDGLINEVREYMDTELVTDTFGDDKSA